MALTFLANCSILYARLLTVCEMGDVSGGNRERGEPAGAGFGQEALPELVVEPRPMDVNALREAMVWSGSFLEVILGGLAGAGSDRAEIAAPCDRAAVARVMYLAKQIRDTALGVLPELPFRPACQVVPSPAACALIMEAKRQATLQSGEKKELIRRTTKMLMDIFGSKVNVGNADIRQKIELFAREYATKSGLNVNVVIELFTNRDGRFYIGVDRSVLEASFRDGDVADMISDPAVTVFRSGVLPTDNFENLLHAKVAALVMSIETTWQSRRAEGEDKNGFLTGLMNRAKAYIAATFEEQGVLGRISECTSMDELQKFAQALPVDEESFDVMKKAHLLLKVMHIILLYESDVDEASHKANAANLRAEIENFCVHLTSGGCYINPPRRQDGSPNPDFQFDNYGMPIDRVEVSDSKDTEAVIGKMLRRGMYDTREISDFLRMRMFLRKEDCYNDKGEYDPQKTELAMEKLLGIIMAKFGNDIDMKSLSYSVDTGKTNEASVGKHRGLHVNFKFKSSCKGNGVDEKGNPITKAVDVELHLLAYMSKEDYDKDHERYEESRKKELYKRMELDRGINDFALDLISALSNDSYKFQFESLADPFDDIRHIDEDVRNVYERQLGTGDENFFPEDVDLEALMKEGWVLFSRDKLRLFVLLLAVLTKRNADGGLANAELIKYMEKYFPGKLEKLLMKYSDMIKADKRFANGGELVYLARTLQAKIRFVRNAIVANQTSSAKVVSSGELFSVGHSLRVVNAGGSGGGRGKSPQLTFVTRFDGNCGREKPTMERPYDGPVGLSPVRDAGGAINFHWEFRGKGMAKKPIYRIERDEQNHDIVCYLLTEHQKLPLWVLPPDPLKTGRISGTAYPYSYSVKRDPKTNVASLVAEDIDIGRTSGKPINVAKITDLYPSMGFAEGSRQGRFLQLVKEAGRVWGSVKRGESTDKEYGIAV